MNIYTITCLILKGFIGFIAIFYIRLLLEKIKLAAIVDEFKFTLEKVLKKRALLSNVVSDYYHSIDSDGVRAIVELDRVIVQAQGMIEIAEDALSASSKNKISYAYKNLKNFRGKEKSDLSKLDASWDYRVSLLLHKICEQVSKASKLSSKLDYPFARGSRRPTLEILKDVLTN